MSLLGENSTYFAVAAQILSAAFQQQTGQRLGIKLKHSNVISKRMKVNATTSSQNKKKRFILHHQLVDKRLDYILVGAHREHCKSAFLYSAFTLANKFGRALNL